MKTLIIFLCLIASVGYAANPTATAYDGTNFFWKSTSNKVTDLEVDNLVAPDSMTLNGVVVSNWSEVSQQAALGAVYITNSVTVIISTVDVAVVVTTASWVVSANLFNFNFVTNSLVYTGATTRLVGVAKVSWEPESSNNQQMEFQVRRNGTNIFRGFAEVDSGDPKSVTVPFDTAANSGDVFQIWMLNSTSTRNAVIQALNWWLKQ